ncbi:hypothetical protein [Pseudomonas phage vB_PsaM_M1]|nr:hypothetical protein [Pseudomonas phage vB_PsaM_M1]
MSNGKPSKFKAGDRVKRVASSHNGMVVGDTAIVRYQEGSSYLYLEGYEHSHDPINFELVEDEKQSTAKWLKENKWFIRTGSPEKSKLVQEWLFEHDYHWCIGDEVNDFGEAYLTNTDSGAYLSPAILHGGGDKTNAQEIKIEFETVVKSVQFPEIAPKKTEQQLCIEELEATIAQASTQIKQLKEEM